MYQHRGLNYSVFESDRQIAAFTKNQIKIGAGDRYDIRVNHDVNIGIIICLVVAVDQMNFNDGIGVTLDFGNIGSEAKSFDEQWEPR